MLNVGKDESLSPDYFATKKIAERGPGTRASNKEVQAV
jgi:hypothetical protein